MAMAVFPKRQTLQIFRVPISQLVKGLFIEILVWLPDYEQSEEACSCTRKSFDVTEQLNFSQHLTAIVPENESLVWKKNLVFKNRKLSLKQKLGYNKQALRI